MHSFRLMALLPVCLGLAGCSYMFGDDGHFRERAMDYKKAESIAPLQVPEGSASKELKQRYPIPVLGRGEFYVPKDSDDLPKPQALLNVNEDAGVELRGDEDDRHWLVVNQSRERLWPQVKEFLTSNGLLVDEENRNLDLESLELKLGEAILRERTPLEKYLTLIKIVSVIAPLLGLLGTVTGMINTFQVITLFGTNDPKLLAGGISEALVTTVLGLAVAIPMVFFHNLAYTRSKAILMVLEEESTGLIAQRAERGAA